MMQFWQLVYLDIKHLIQDRAIALTLFGGVIFYALLYPLPYLNQVATEQQIVLVDLDKSSLSRNLARHVDASPKIALAVSLDSITSAQEWIEADKAHGLLVIPEGFRRDLILGKGVTLSYGGDANYFLIYSAIAEGLVASGLDAAKKVQLVGLLSSGVQAKQAELSLNPVTLNAVPVFNQGLGYLPYVVPAVLLLVLHQTLLIASGILGAGQWQREGYWQQVSALALVCSRMVALLCIYAYLTSFYLGFCFYAYDLTLQGSPLALGLLMFAFLLATAAAGVAFSCLFTRRDLPTQVLLLVSMPILFVSGFVWPLELIPAPLIWLSQAIPAVPAMMGLLKLTQMGADWHSLIGLWLQLWGLFVVFFVLAIVGVKYRQRMYRNAQHNVPVG
jgi:ABC-2 type transport system permease protein